MKPVKKQTIVKIYQNDSVSNPNAYQIPVKVLKLNGIYTVNAARKMAAKAVKDDKRLLYCIINHVYNGFTAHEFGKYQIL